MSDVELNDGAVADAPASGEGETVNTFPTDVGALYEKEGDNLEDALRQALGQYYARGGKPRDGVSITILVGDGVWNGASDSFDVDLENYEVSGDERPADEDERPTSEDGYPPPF